MNSKSPRSYNCKDEELPPICRYVALSMKRDLPDFTGFSPRFNEEFVTNYETAITKVEDLVSPQSETAERKKITARIATTLNALSGYASYLGGYLEMADGSINLSATDFGLSDLRKGINVQDPEKVIDRLKNVLYNVNKYKAELTEQGFSEDLNSKLNEALVSLSADRQEQYRIQTNRRALVDGNLELTNSLYATMKRICQTGKILYRDTNTFKIPEYTFTELKKKVRRVSKPKENGTEEPANGTPVPPVSPS